MESVIDLAPLLAPLPGNNPSGVDMQSLPEYLEMENAARVDDTNAGIWTSKDAKGYQAKKVVEICTRVLSTASKDLRAVSRLGQALAMQHGFQGALASLDLAHGLVDGFWDTLFPELDEGEPIYRRAPVEQFVSRVASALEFHSLTGTGGAAYGVAHYVESRAVDQLRKMPTKIDKNTGAEITGERLYQNALEEGKISGEMFDKAMDTAPPNDLVTNKRLVVACRAALEKLDQLCLGKMRDDPPDMTKLSEVLKKSHDILEEVITRRKISEEAIDTPPAQGTNEPSAVAGGPTPAGSVAVAGPTLTLPAGSVAGREQAFALLEQVSRYFRATEPHSPVSLLLDRAVTWGKMPLPDVLRELVEDDGALRNIDKLLGIKRSE